MATDKFLPQIEAQAIAADEKQFETSNEKEDGSHLSANYISYNSDEPHDTSLRNKFGKLSSQVYTKVRSKFKNHRCFCGHQRQ